MTTIQSFLVKNYKLIASSFIIMLPFIVFLYTLEPRLLKLEQKVEDLTKTVELDERKYDLTYIKLETTLAQISKDLEFIKQKLFGGGN